MTSNTPTATSILQSPGYDSHGTGKRTNVNYLNEAKDVTLHATKPLNYIGTPATGWTAFEYGDAFRRTTVLRCTGSVTVAISGAGAAGVGTQLYTFPSKDIFIGSPAKLSVGVTAASHPSDTPVIGVGSVQASGAVSVLSGTSTFVDIIDSSTLSGMNGTVNTYGKDLAGVFKAASSSPKAWLNLALTWSGADTLTIALGSTVVINWSPADVTEDMSVLSGI